jgi:hypothetical protein
MPENLGGRDVTINAAALDALVASPAGPVAKLLVSVAQETTQIAKRNAPVGDRSSRSPQGHPSGWLRSNIAWTIGTLDGDLCVEIVSDAVTSPASPRPGEPYALHNEVPSLRRHAIPSAWAAKEGPYLQPAFVEALNAVLGGGVTYTPRA